jgi:hypothetical protein
MKDDPSKLPKNVVCCLLNWGDRKTPIPDSLWHGRFCHLINIIGGFDAVLTPAGKAMRVALQKNADAIEAGEHLK